MEHFIPDSDLGGTDTIKEGFVPPRILDESYGKVTMQRHENLSKLSEERRRPVQLHRDDPDNSRVK